jgi:predicted membrane-bound spermidine synthase
MEETSWQTLLIIAVVIVGVLIGPYDILLVLQRMWKQRQADRIARGEDVRPKKLGWDEEDWDDRR